MRPPLRIVETADEFWSLAGEQEAFPRSLRRPIALALPLSIVLLPWLTLERAQSWLQAENIACGVTARDRALRACLIARYGHGVVFIDGTDSEDEQRFSLAHELAHFLLQYWRPRRRVVERLGQVVLPVLDGDRAPTKTGRAHALLAGIPVGFHVHLMERGTDGQVERSGIEGAESEADQLALELIAPEQDVTRRLRERAEENHRDLAVQLLTEAYGLPMPIAQGYAATLLSQRCPNSSLVSRLRVVQ